MKHAHWCMWTMHAITWRWGKPRCRYLQQDAARTQYADDVVMQFRWPTWPTMNSVTIHRRRGARHKYYEFTAFQEITALGKSRLLQFDSYYGCAAVRGLKHSYRRADKLHAWLACPDGAGEVGRRMTTGRPKRLQATLVLLRAQCHGTRSTSNSRTTAAVQQPPRNSGRGHQPPPSHPPLRHGGA